MSTFLENRGIRNLRSVRAEDLEAYRQYMEQEQFACSSISRSVASIRAFFQFHLMKGTILLDPSVELKPPKILKKAPAVLTAEEIDRLIHMPDLNTPKGIRDAAMLELLSATGLRVSELIHLDIKDVRLRQGILVCRESGRERRIPISSMCQKILSRYLAEARDAFVRNSEQTMLFTNCSGKPISRQGFWKVLKGYAEEAGIEKDITPHTLRHSFAVQMLQQGTDVYEVKEFMGHSDVSTTQAYLSVSL